MKTLNFPIKFMIYMTFRAVRHPRTPISYYYCSNCKVRFGAKEPECPKCHEKVEESPENRKESPIPWYGSVIVIFIGVIVCIVGACHNLPALDRLGDGLVFIPLGNLFGMSLRR